MIAVIGGGAFGTALAAVFARSGQSVRLWMRRGEAAVALNKSHINSDYLPDIRLPDELIASNELKDIQGASVLLLALPAQQTSTWLQENSKLLPDTPIICCAKGIDRNSGNFQSEIVKRHFAQDRIAVLSGPGFAQEIAMGKPTALTLAATSEALAKTLQNSLSTDSLRLYSTTDVLGVEFGGAIKNIIAIGCGVTIGANLGQSARAALLTRGFSEMVKLGVKLGARFETLSGLSGLGDLTLTATSELSRNYQLGLSLGRGDGGDIGKTTEGAYSARMAIRLAQSQGLELPVSETVCRLVENEIDIRTAVKALLSRPLKNE